MIGATVEEAQRRMGYREYLTRLAWLDTEQNRPSRSDHYLMRIAQRIMQFAGWGRKNPEQVTLDLQKVEFTRPKPAPALSYEERRQLAIDQSKAAWGAALGRKLK